MEEKYVEQYGAEVERLQRLDRALTHEEVRLLEYCQEMYKKYSN